MTRSMSPLHSGLQPALLTGAALSLVLATAGPTMAQGTSDQLNVAWPEVYSFVDMPSKNGGRQGERLVWLGIHETPMRIAPDGTIEPNLATSWEISEDGLVHTVKLRQGVQFHGGWGEMTAEDWVWTAHQQWGPESNHGGQFIAKTNLDRIETPDKYTVEFILKQPNAFFKEYYGTIRDDVALAIYSKKRAEELGPDAATTELPDGGTGPYQVESWTSDTDIMLRSFPDYWGEKPAYDRVNIVQISEPSTVLAALETGQVDLARVPVTARQRVEAAGLGIRPGGVGFARVVFAGQFCYTEFDGQPVPPRPGYDPSLPWVGDCNDPESLRKAQEVRRAMSMAIDRQALVDAIAGGHGRPAYVDNLLGYYADRYMKPDWKVPYDPEQAKQMLADAGYPNGFDVPFVCDASGPPLLTEFCEATAGMWSNIGLNVQIQRVAGDAIRKQRVERTFNGVFLELQAGVTPIPEARGFGEIPTAAFNSGYEMPGLVELVREAALTVTPQQLDEVREKQYQWVFDQGFVILTAEFDEIYAFNKAKVGEWPRTPFNGHSAELMDFEHLHKPQ